MIYDAEQNPLASGTIAPVEKHIFGKTSCGSFPELPAHGKMDGACGGQMGDVCNFDCETGFEQSSPTGPAFTCGEAAWNDQNGKSPKMQCTDIDECSLKPCQNNATCWDSIRPGSHAAVPVGTQICDCKPGFFGDTCDGK